MDEQLTDRLDVARARLADRAAVRAAFVERRVHGVAARRRVKLARLCAAATP